MVKNLTWIALAGVVAGLFLFIILEKQPLGQPQQAAPEETRSRAMADEILAAEKLNAAEVNRKVGIIAAGHDLKGEGAILMWNLAERYLYNRMEYLEELKKKTMANADLTDIDKRRVGDALQFEEASSKELFYIFHSRVTDESDKLKAADR